jgi:hypothetical protein
MYVVVVAVLALGIYGFAVLAGFQTRLLSRRSKRTAESMYGEFAGPAHRQRSNSERGRR